MHIQKVREESPLRGRTSKKSWWSGPTACLATLLALPASANIDIPNDPLTTGSRVAPNVLFILDDSGSMGWRYMYNQSIDRIVIQGNSNSGPTGNNTGSDNAYTTTDTNVAAIYDQNYVTNTIYYNPAVTYLPWIRADGSRMTGGTSYTSAYSNAQQASGSVNLSSNTQVFYVPKGVAGENLSSVSNYYRYELQSNSAGGRIVRSEYGSVDASSESRNWTGLSANSGMANINSFAVPAGATRVTVRASGGSYGGFLGFGNGADLYLRRGANPTTGQYDCRSVSNGNNETCVVDSPAAGTWNFGLNAGTNYSGVTVVVEIERTNSCDGSRSGRTWINCEESVPANRSAADERTNFATWYSYHRTRMKAAKAGAGEAFASQDSKVRVGFRTIWNRSNLDIPVNDGNDGLFVDNEANQATGARATDTRSNWYDRLYAASGSNGTPLRNALYNAGEYFSGSSSGGPYGPQSGTNQYSCRQNFAILTTDGYWNSGSPGFGNEDGRAGALITGPNNQRYQYSAEGPYSDGYSDTLADVAMRYWKTDLRTDMTNNVPTSSDNPAFWQHMVTFGISIGLTGTTGWSSVADVPSNANWPRPGNDSPNNVDDLLHAAVNGRGAFVAASNPAEFSRGLNDALNAIAQRTSSFSNVATNSVSLDTGSQVFNASYVSGIWTGQVTARAIDRTGVSDTVTWTSTLPAWTARNIFTRTSAGAGTAFPTATQVQQLARGNGVANFEVSGQDNANYIKGERRLEADSNNGGRLRNRLSVLGDIIGSSPAYVRDTNTLYVGANDGMMHAFDAASGRELFAYVPGITNVSGMAALSRPDYAHRFFVDGPVVVSPRTLTPGKNLLVGTMGRGGKGVYSLDVSTPATFANANVKWERNSGDLMGYVLGKPIMARVKDTTANGKLAVVMGNGVNSTANRAALIVLDLETGAVIREIDTGVGSATAPNALSAATGVYADDGRTLAYVYAGDLQGNVWKFDLGNADKARWTASLLFTAADSNGKVQPISSAVAVATNPTTRQRWVFFGTGRYLTVEDANPANATTQSMYAVIDDTTTTRTRSNLQQRVVQVSGAESNGYPVRAFQAAAPLPANQKGWYIDLPGVGERIVQDAQVVSNFMVTASMMPTGDACEADGTGFINALDAFTGTGAKGSYFDLDGDGNTEDQAVGSGNLPVGSVNTGVGMPTLPNLLRGQIVVGGTGGSDPRSVGSLRPRWDRVSWREVRRD